MNQIIRSLRSRPPSPAFARKDAFRRPHYDCQEHMDALNLVLYIPGVDASSVEITVEGPDLTVTAKKSHLVRPNWRALHLEPVQHDYQLRLRLGNRLNFDGLEASLRDGALAIMIPKKASAAMAGAAA
jgi:HSP20 family molecular chaperone IbpA